MNMCCLSCEHCNPNRTNDLGEVRCTKFSTFTKVLYSCNSYSYRGQALKDIVEKAKGVIPNDR